MTSSTLGARRPGNRKMTAATPATTTPTPAAIAHLGIRAFLATGRRAPPRKGPRPATGCKAGKWSAAAASARPSLATRAPGKGRAAPPAWEPESPSSSRLNPRSTLPDARLLPGAADSGGDAPVGASGANLGADAPVGVSGANVGTGATSGATRADAGIGGGAVPPRPVMGAAAPGPFAAMAAGGGLGGPAAACLGVGATSAGPPRSNASPDGAGPSRDSGEGEESRSRARGGPPPAAGECGANDTSSANPSGGVLLEDLSGPSSNPGRALPFDCRRSSGRGIASREIGKSPGRGIASRETGK